MYPMKMVPAYKDYLWGGRKLNKYFNKNSVYDKTAESWELSCCNDGLSIVDNGIYQGQTLKNVLSIHHCFIGMKISELNEFPLLIKLIDAHDKLSIQVHPSDELSDKNKGQQGKAEMWYVLDCEKDAFLYMGFRENISKYALRDLILSGDICNYLNKIYVKPGDVFFIPPGTVHAIGSGILIAEIQQNSNTTFRIFDYDRVDKQGKKRQLHIDEAERVCDVNKYVYDDQQSMIVYKQQDYEIKRLVECKYFRVLKYNVNKKVELYSKKESFQALLFIDSNGVINYKNENYNFQKGDCYFIPAGIGEYEILGNCMCLISKM